jgi:hypothetical protein
MQNQLRIFLHLPRLNNCTNFTSKSLLELGSSGVSVSTPSRLTYPQLVSLHRTCKQAILSPLQPSQRQANQLRRGSLCRTWDGNEEYSRFNHLSFHSLQEGKEKSRELHPRSELWRGAFSSLTDGLSTEAYIQESKNTSDLTRATRS